jgi:hypothetical protein
MVLLIQKEDVESLIDSQRAAVRLYAKFAAGIFIFGILLVLSANLFAQTNAIKTITNIGGTFISTLSGFPIKEIINRRLKINAYTILKRHVILIADKDSGIGEEDKKKIMDLIMEVIKRNALEL